MGMRRIPKTKRKRLDMRWKGIARRDRKALGRGGRNQVQRGRCVVPSGSEERFDGRS
jgi:hypothetical protein